MIARLRRSQEEDKGFTLVELLVVIIIIGILSAVAVPVYLNQQKKAKDTAANSDVSNLGKQVQTALIDQSDPSKIQFKIVDKHYMLSIDGGATFDEDLGRVSDGVVLLKGDGTAAGTAAVPVSGVGNATVTSSNWCIAVQHPDGDKKTYRYSATGGIESGVSCKDA
jgi:type IV pilus assembly protein PilA